MTNRWDKTGTYSVELQVVDGQTQDFDGNRIDYIDLSDFNIDYAELVIEFRSVGWHTPMSMYSGPDHLGWPAEGDDERSLESAYLLCEGAHIIDLPVVTQKLLFVAYEPQIVQQDLN